ncbi:MAG: P1 family peptidase [Parvibaculum sp.]|uniref:P1 family peptidase n=1 Tax=Parvibaculum sp. TaxID=2024848 RepID=UPI0027202781|nr:P1 family peptidase [Parvibaculum sp.]MDO8839089.1 P1 family peptidase [Parvibaculum sp.]
MHFGAIRKGPLNLITDVEGISVGNAEDAGARTGVTVVLPEPRAVAGGDMRGGGPGTRETDLLDAACLVDAVDAVVLSGGSSWGLEAASGAAAWLGARGKGYRVGSSPLVSPIVPAAILFDLANGGDKAWGETPPYGALGRAACEAASGSFRLGNAGAGLGAIAGQYKGGLGSASAVAANGFTVGALVAANPFGSAVVPGAPRFWAAPYEMDGEFGGLGWPDGKGVAALDPLTGSKSAPQPGGNTSIGVVATDADLTPAECRRVAIMAQDGLARAVRPVHAPVDGDAIFVLATARRSLGPAPRHMAVASLGAMAADCVARAVARALWEAETLGQTRAFRDLHGL